MPQFVPTETECRSGCKSSVMGQAGNVLLTPGYGTFSCRRWLGCSRCGKRLLADDLSTLFGIPDPAQLPWTDRNSPLLGGSGATPATGGSLTTPQVPITQPPTSPKTFGGVAATGGATPADTASSGRTPRIVDRIPGLMDINCRAARAEAVSNRRPGPCRAAAGS